MRGLDYYNHTIFEFISDKNKSQGTVLAGGRYNGLLSRMIYDEQKAKKDFSNNVRRFG